MTEKMISIADANRNLIWAIITTAIAFSLATLAVVFSFPNQICG